jgi:hypothetical protein
MSAKQTNAIKGSELLKQLDSEASFDLKQTRQLVEDACSQDIAAYFSGSGIGQITRASIATLIAPAIAGGQWGFKSLETRLENLSLEAYKIGDIANEILELASIHAKVLNFARSRCGAVQSYVFRCKEGNFDATALGVSQLKSKAYKEKLEDVFETLITDSDELLSWSEKVNELMENLSIEQERHAAEIEDSIGKGRKGSISTKSISNYSKQWLSFVQEKFLHKFNESWRGDLDESISHRVKYLQKYEPMTWSKMRKFLDETQTSRRSFSSSPKNTKTKSANPSAKLITSVRDLGGRELRITHNLSGLDADLIKPVLNLLNGKLTRNPKAASISSSFESEGWSLAVEMEKPTKADLIDIEVELNSHL